MVSVDGTHTHRYGDPAAQVRLGLFRPPYADPSKANAASTRAGRHVKGAPQESMNLLRNRTTCCRSRHSKMVVHGPSAPPRSMTQPARRWSVSCRRLRRRDVCCMGRRTRSRRAPRCEGATAGSPRHLRPGPGGCRSGADQGRGVVEAARGIRQGLGDNRHQPCQPTEGVDQRGFRRPASRCIRRSERAATGLGAGHERGGSADGPSK